MLQSATHLTLTYSSARQFVYAVHEPDPKRENARGYAYKNDRAFAARFLNRGALNMSAVTVVTTYCAARLILYRDSRGVCGKAN